MNLFFCFLPWVCVLKTKFGQTYWYLEKTNDVVWLQIKILRRLFRTVFFFSPYAKNVFAANKHLWQLNIGRGNCSTWRATNGAILSQLTMFPQLQAFVSPNFYLLVTKNLGLQTARQMCLVVRISRFWISYPIFLYYNENQILIYPLLLNYIFQIKRHL